MSCCSRAGFYVAISNGRHEQGYHAYLVCSLRMACLAVSGESALEPGAFLTGANSSWRCTSSSATRSARGKVSKMKSSSLMPCKHIKAYTSSNELLLESPVLFHQDVPQASERAPDRASEYPTLLETAATSMLLGLSL